MVVNVFFNKFEFNCNLFGKMIFILLLIVFIINTIINKLKIDKFEIKNIVPEDGIEPSTYRFSICRSTSELPTH